MHKRAVNPWTWQDARGFTQAWRVEGPNTVVFVSGQGPLDSNGQVSGADFESQARLTFDNLGRVLDESGATFADIVKLTAFLIDITQLPTYGRVKSSYISGRQPASTALQVSALAIPAMQLEVEAIAVL